MLAYQLQHLSELRGVLTAAAAILAIVLDFMVSMLQTATLLPHVKLHCRAMPCMFLQP